LLQWRAKKDGAGVASKKSREMGRRGKFRAWTTGEGELSSFEAAPRAGARAPVGVQAHLNGSLLAVAAGVIGVDAGLEVLLACHSFLSGSLGIPFSPEPRPRTPR